MLKFRETLRVILDYDRFPEYPVTHRAPLHVQEAYDIGKAIKKFYLQLEQLIPQEIREEILDSLLNAGINYPELLSPYYTTEGMLESELEPYQRAKERLIELAGGEFDFVHLMSNMALKLVSSAKAGLILSGYANIVEALKRKDLDPSRLHKIMKEVLYNAHKYNPEISERRVTYTDRQKIEEYNKTFFETWSKSNELGEKRTQAVLNEAKKFLNETFEVYQHNIETIADKYKELLRQCKIIAEQFGTKVKSDIDIKEVARIVNEAIWNTITPEECSEELRRLYNHFLSTIVVPTEPKGVESLNETKDRQTACKLFLDPVISQPNFAQVRWKLSRQALLETKGTPEDIIGLKYRLGELWNSYLAGLEDYKVVAERRRAIVQNFFRDNGSLVSHETIANTVITTLFDTDLQNKLDSIAQNKLRENRRREVIDTYRSILKSINLPLDTIEITLHGFWNTTQTPEELKSKLDNYLSNIQIELEATKIRIEADSFIHRHSQDIDPETLQAIVNAAMQRADNLEVFKRSLQIYLEHYLAYLEDLNRRTKESVAEEFIKSKINMLDLEVLNRLAQEAIDFLEGNNLNELRTSMEELFNYEFQKQTEKLFQLQDTIIDDFRRKCSGYNRDIPLPDFDTTELIISTAINITPFPEGSPTNDNIANYAKTFRENLDFLLRRWQWRTKYFTEEYL